MNPTKWITFTRDLLPLVMSGRKTVTRRVIRPQPTGKIASLGYWQSADDGTWAWQYQERMEDPLTPGIVYNQLRDVGKNGLCPYGASGAILGVKEGYKINGANSEGRIVGTYTVDGSSFNVVLTPREHGLWLDRQYPMRATPGRFMYRSLCRTRLLNLSVRVERVQDITEEDAIFEGVSDAPYFLKGDGDLHPIQREMKVPIAVWRFRHLWDSINAKRGYPWSADDLPDNWPDGKPLYGNPWVWVTEFERIENANQTTD